jgi:hypothetical protein
LLANSEPVTAGWLEIGLEREPTPGLEPGTPSLRGQCGWGVSSLFPGSTHHRLTNVSFVDAFRAKGDSP